MTKKKLFGMTSTLSFLLIVAGCRGLALSESAPQEAAKDSQTTQPVAADKAAEIGETSSRAAFAPVPEAVSEETSSGDDAAAVPGEAVVETISEGKPAAAPLILPKPENELVEGEYRWNQLLPRDGIRPIYEDELEFVEAKGAPYDDDELVIGVEINGEAKAYAIGPLNSREMVNDTVGGVPILVTW